MNYRDAQQFYGSNGRQLGDKIIFLTSNGSETQAQGYKITSFDGFDPRELEYVTTETVSDINSMTWDKVYDIVFGTPTAPDFSKVVA